MPILRRVGLVLIVVGLLDIGAMIYAIMHGMSYSSSLNIFAVIAGVFLLRGSLRAASVIRRFATFFLAGGISILVLSPLFWPVGLILTELRLEPLRFAIAGIMGGITIWVLLWVVSELGREPILEAITNSGSKRPTIRPPLMLGVALALTLMGLIMFATHGAASDRAKNIAEQQVGPGYQYQVTSLHMVSSKGVTNYSALVTAWNDREIKTVPVHWTN